MAQNNFTVDVELKYRAWLTENLYRMNLRDFHLKQFQFKPSYWAEAGRGDIALRHSHEAFN